MNLKMLNVSVGQNKRDGKENEGETKFCRESLPLERKEKNGVKIQVFRGWLLNASLFNFCDYFPPLLQ